MRNDTCYVCKVSDTGNKGHREVFYNVNVEGARGQLDEMTLSELEELAEFLCRYVKREKEKEGGAR